MCNCPTVQTFISFFISISLFSYSYSKVPYTLSLKSTQVFVTRALGLGQALYVFSGASSLSLSRALTALRVAKLDWKIGQHFVLSLCFVCVCVRVLQLRNVASVIRYTRNAHLALRSLDTRILYVTTMKKKTRTRTTLARNTVI